MKWSLCVRVRCKPQTTALWSVSRQDSGGRLSPPGIHRVQLLCGHLILSGWIHYDVRVAVVPRRPSRTRSYLEYSSSEAWRASDGPWTEPTYSCWSFVVSTDNVRR